MFMYTASACKTKLATVFVYTLDGYSSLLQLYPSRSGDPVTCTDVSGTGLIPMKDLNTVLMSVLGLEMES